MTNKTILTGLRANNNLHIGNYFGALLPIVDMAKSKSDEYRVNLFVPDLHSFTTPIDHSQLKAQILNNLRMFAAAGLPLDNPNVHIYRQSYIPAHSELTWILDCFTGMGQLSRMTQYKDKASKLNEENVSVGLFNYPVLMAADILLYNASYVPVGDDQTQHLEFTRDIAQRMNSRFGELFVIPEEVKIQHDFFGKDQGLRIMDLADPSRKMSKSDESGKGIIFLTDSPEEARKKIMSATTDSISSVTFDPVNQPGVSNLITLLSLLKGESQQAAAAKFEQQTMYGPFKEEVANTAAEFLADYQARLQAVNDKELLNKLQASEAEMNKVAYETLTKVQKAVGLR